VKRNYEINLDDNNEKSMMHIIISCPAFDEYKIINKILFSTIKVTIIITVIK
jgi:hypothetical protein